MTLDDFLPYVLPRVKGCAAPLATQQVRLAIIELCKRSLLWRESQTSQNTVADQTAYAYTPGSGQQVVHLLEMWLNGSEVSVVDAEKGRRLDAASAIDVYAYGTLNGFVLKPAQVADLPIVTYGAVAPSLAATSVPDALGKYVEGIAHGAVRRLQMMPNMEFTDPMAADKLYRPWEECIGDATVDAIQGHARAEVRVQASWF